LSVAAKEMGLLVGTLLLARDLAQREHWKTTSYATHVATEKFYDGVVGLADQLVESYQGAMDDRLDVPILDHDKDMGLRELLQAQLEYIHETRYDAVPRDQSALQNIIDEIESLYQTTIYLLSLS
jgi:hypothetical protein